MPKKSNSVANHLRKVLADTFMLQVNTQAAHWNVTGPHFAALHELFGEQYESLLGAVDELAERLRALGEPAPVGLVDMAGYTSVKDGLAKGKAEVIIKGLHDGHLTAIKVLRGAIEAADDADDDVTEDMLIQRLGAHEKMVWMLRSLLER